MKRDLDTAFLLTRAARLPFLCAGGVGMDGTRGMSNRIYVCAVEDEDIHALTHQLTQFGFVVQAVETFSALTHLVEGGAPAFVLAEMNWRGGDGTLDDIVTLMRRTVGPDRLVLIGEDGALANRLRAVKTGARAFLIRPLNPIDVVDRLETLLDDGADASYRVLIVDDDQRQLKYYKAVLEKAGIRALAIANPMDVLSPMTDFRPDLVLIDLYMPGVSGYELAAALRQDPANVSVPIVFLSAEADQDTQQVVLRAGGDDFLTKPIKPAYLVSAVKTRARRFRELRSFMLRDSLTGLLNHASTKENLAVEVSRMRRSGQPLACALIDIDHFKTVNDRFGHPTGDRVIRSLATLLKQRLRTTDVIGRYGGEEFAVALSGTPPDAAFHVMEEIRRCFQDMEQRHDGGVFQITFSCGLSCFPDFADPDGLIDAADKALYEAKQNGRNRVRMA